MTTLQNYKQGITDAVKNASAQEKINSLTVGFGISKKIIECERRWI